MPTRFPLLRAATLALTFCSSLAFADNSFVPSKDMAATMEMLRNIAANASDLVDSPNVTEATYTIGGHRVRIDGVFHEIFRSMLRTYDETLRAECDTCAQWDQKWFLEEGGDVETIVGKSLLRRSVVDPLLDMAEHAAFEAGLLGGELGKAAFGLKVAGEAGETALSVLWMKILGPMHFLCHIIDAGIFFGTRPLQSWIRSVSYQGQFGGSLLTGTVDFWRFAYFRHAATRAQRNVEFAMGPFDVDEARLKELDLQGPRWWGFVENTNRRNFMKQLLKNHDRPQSVKLNRKAIMSKRLKRFAFMVVRPSYIGGKTPMDRALKKPQLWVIAVQNLFEKVLLPFTDKDIGQAARKNLEDLEAAPQDEIRRELAQKNSLADPEATDFKERMLKAIELAHNPKISPTVRMVHVNFIEAGMKALIYQRTADVLESKIDLINGGDDKVRSRARDIRRHFAYAWKFGLVGRYVGEFFDSLKLASIKTSKAKLVDSKYDSMEAFLNVWEALQENTRLSEIRTNAEMEDYEIDLQDRYRSLLGFRPWQAKLQSSFISPIGFTFHPWNDERAINRWFPFYRNLPLCRDLHAKGH